MNSTPMSPFLAQVQVINVAGKSAETEATATPTEESIHALAKQVKDKALAQAAAGLQKANDSLDQQATEAREVQDDSPKHHSKSKSGDGDMFVAAVPIVAIVFTFLWLIVRALMAPFTNRQKRGAQGPVVMEGLSADEAALLEKLQRTLTQMESRVESLETILIDPARTKEKYGTKL